MLGFFDNLTGRLQIARYADVSMEKLHAKALQGNPVRLF
jgi:hypothetical protein